jgi:hypothetical protein
MVIYNKIYQKERKWVNNGARTGYPFGVSVITRVAQFLDFCVVLCGSSSVI